jgi:phage-related protein
MPYVSSLNVIRGVAARCSATGLNGGGCGRWRIYANNWNIHRRLHGAWNGPTSRACNTSAITERSLADCLLAYTNFCIIRLLIDAKPLTFCGSSLDDLREFPLSARRDAGYQLDQVQRGGDPDDWKPMNTIGQGVREIRIRDANGAFRIIYLAKFADAIYVLHCFQKKTQKTSQADLDLAAKRYRELKEVKP